MSTQGWADQGRADRPTGRPQSQVHWTTHATGRADLVSVSLESPRTAGSAPDAVAEAVVYAAAAADVTHVMIDGVSIVDDGAHRSIDVAAELAASISELVAEVGS